MRPGSLMMARAWTWASQVSRNPRKVDTLGNHHAQSTGLWIDQTPLIQVALGHL
jgi:hypothetical protein